MGEGELVVWSVVVYSHSDGIWCGNCDYTSSDFVKSPIGGRYGGKLVIFKGVGWDRWGSFGSIVEIVLKIVQLIHKMKK